MGYAKTLRTEMSLVKSVKRRFRSLSSGRRHSEDDLYLDEETRLHDSRGRRQNIHRNEIHQDIERLAQDDNDESAHIPHDPQHRDDIILSSDSDEGASKDNSEEEDCEVIDYLEVFRDPKTSKYKARKVTETKPKSKMSLRKELDELKNLYGTSVKELGNMKAELNRIRIESEDLEPHGGTTSLIYPPPLLERNESESSSETMRNSAVYERWFKVVPTFQIGDDVRRFLLHMNAVIIDTGMKISQKSFRAILLNKISYDARERITGGEILVTKTVDQLYRALQCHYDVSEPSGKALVKLFQLTRNDKIDSMEKFLKEATRLLHLVKASTAEKARHFSVALSNILPKRICEYLGTFIKRYQSRHNDSYPDINDMVQFLKSYSEEIEDNFKESAKAAKKARIHEVQLEDLSNQIQRSTQLQEESFKALDQQIQSAKNQPGNRPQQNRNGQRTPRFCNYCKGTSHTESYCFKKKNANRSKICSKCGRNGHELEDCRVRCRLCNNQAHTSELCTVYPAMVPCQDCCPYCFDTYKVKLYHPANKCKNPCAPQAIQKN